MRELVFMTLVLLAGIALGLVFYSGLWLTVSKGIRAKRPWLLFIASFVLRSVIAVAGIYLVSQRDWKKMLVCLLGFTIAKLMQASLVKKRLLVKNKMI